MRRLTPLILFAFSALITIAITSLYNRPQNVGTDVPAGKLKSVSFAPFREGFSPLKELFPLPEHLDEDLRLLAPKTESIRTYSSLGGMEPLPAIARKYGVTMTQGAWLGWGEKDNQKELAALIASANANPDVVTRLIVGNEVLLRGEMEPTRLIDYIRAVKRSVKQPVSYADVWSMYMKYPALINEVDFITIHILPYWEDEPIAIEDAPAHLEKVFRAVESEARALGVTKPIFIGESGWPSAGRQRGAAVPSVVNAARYTRGMIEVAHRHGFDYNIVEAFDQPWKAELEGIVGANWGLFSAAREPRYPLSGGVMETPSWRLRLAFSVLLGAFVFVLFFPRIKNASTTSVLLLAGLSLALSTALVTFAGTAWTLSYDTTQRAQACFWILANLVIAVAVLDSLTSTSNEKTLLPRFSLHAGYLLFALFALYRTYSLARHGRYLTFPIEQYTVPIAGIVGLLALPRFFQSPHSTNSQGVSHPHRFARFVATLLLLATFALFLGETRAFIEARDLRSVYPRFQDALPVALEYTLRNNQLLIWSGYLIALAIFLRRRGTVASMPVTSTHSHPLQR